MFLRRWFAESPIEVTFGFAFIPGSSLSAEVTLSDHDIQGERYVFIQGLNRHLIILGTQLMFLTFMNFPTHLIYVRIPGSLQLRMRFLCRVA